MPDVLHDTPAPGRCPWPSGGEGGVPDAPKLIPNLPTPEGWELGYHVARLYDGEVAKLRTEGKPMGERCDTCAFRRGSCANGTPQALMDALKCGIEGQPFYCHEDDKPCRGWAVMRSDHLRPGRAPWDFVGGHDG